MEIRHLRCFVAVADELHFGRAAARLQLSPSPVSRTVAELEHELGAALFVREHHAVRLTDAGSVLLPSARKLLAGWSDFLDSGRELGRERRGPRLKVGSPSLASATVLDHVLAVLDEVRPGVSVDVEFGSSSELLPLVRGGQLDFTVAHLPVDSAVFGSMPLARYTMSVVVASSDELAGSVSLSSGDLAGRRVLMLDSALQPTTIERVQSWIESAGAVVEQVTGPDLVRLAQLVRHGRGITLSSETGVSAQLLHQPGLTTIPLSDPGPSVELGLVWARAADGKPLVRDVVAHATTLVADGLLTA